jgi:hypothetical protein
VIKLATTTIAGPAITIHKKLCLHQGNSVADAFFSIALSFWTVVNDAIIGMRQTNGVVTKEKT